MSIRIFAAGSILLSSLLVAAAQSAAPASAPRSADTPHKMTLTSPAFSEGQDVPEKHASTPGDQKQLSPELLWTGAPKGTQSFVVTTVDEEFAYNGRSEPFYHWIIFNIPATAKGLPEGVPTAKELPDGSVQPLNIRWHGRACEWRKASLYFPGYSSRHKAGPWCRCVLSGRSQGNGRPHFGPRSDGWALPQT